MKRTLFFLLSMLALAPVLRAADAQLKAAQGKVWIKTGGAAPYEARPGDPLFYFDEVKTGKDSIAHVVFKDGATVLVKGGSEVTIKGKRGDTFLHFSTGEFLIGLKHKLAPNEKFRVRTPAAVAAVRGTLFWGLSDANTKTTSYACFENHIEITAQGKSLLLDPGQKVNIPFGQPPEPPASAADIPADYVNTFALGGSLQGLDELMPAPSSAPPAPAEEAQPEPAAPEPPAETPTQTQ